MKKSYSFTTAKVVIKSEICNRERQKSLPASRFSVHTDVIIRFISEERAIVRVVAVVALSLAVGHLYGKRRSLQHLRNEAEIVPEEIREHFKD